MLDIDKELKALSKIKQRPGNALRASTRALVQDEARRMQAGDRRISAKPARRKVRWAAVCAAAAALMLIAALALAPAQTAKAAGYYTIDINPSVTLSVDENDIVLSADAGNEDAAELLENMQLAGLPIGNALNALVEAAANGGWLKGNGHVLVAHFGDTPGISEQQAIEIVSSAAGDAVNVLVLQSSKENFEASEKQHKSAGLDLLRKNAESLGIDSGMDVDDMITAVEKKKHPQNNGGQGSQKPDTAEHSEKPSPTPKPTASARPEKSGGQQDNGKDNDDRPDKPGGSEKPDKDTNGGSGGNGKDDGKDNSGGNSGGKPGDGKGGDNRNNGKDNR